MKRKLLIGVLFSGLFLYLALRGIDWGDFAGSFHGVNYWYLIPGIVATLLGHFFRSIRWKYMMNPIRRIGVGSLWSATAIAFMVNNLFPARIGEFVRAYAIGKSESVSKSAAFATIVYERVVDVFILIVLMWYCLLTVDGPAWLTRSGIVLIVFNVALLGVLFAMFRYRERFAAVVGLLCRPLPERIGQKIQWWMDSFVEGLGVLRDPSAILPIVIHSVFVWGFATVGVYYSIAALHLVVPLKASLILIVLVSLGSMIPSAPAYVGPMQYACIVGLAIYKIDNSQALAFSTVYHATQFFPITIVGLYYAWRSSIRLSEITSKGTK